MPKNKIEDLRNHLFEAIEMLKEGDLDVERAKAIKGLGDTIVNSARAEVQFMQAQRRTGMSSNFIGEQPAQKQLKPVIDEDAEVAACKCGDNVFPADLETSERLGLSYPRCKTCLDVLPENIDLKKANGLVN